MCVLFPDIETGLGSGSQGKLPAEVTESESRDWSQKYHRSCAQVKEMWSELENKRINQKKMKDRACSVFSFVTINAVY